MRALLDANILISYLLSPAADSPITVVVEAAVTGAFTLLVSEVLLQEFSQRIATKPYLAQRISPPEVERLVDIILAVAETVPRFEEAVPVVTRDPKDDYLLAYAMVGQADYLVTGDSDLLTLVQVAQLRIVTPRQFAILL